MSFRRIETKQNKMAGWLVWKRWTSCERQGLHPFVRTVGFAVVLFGSLAVLPFNATVRETDVDRIITSPVQPPGGVRVFSS